MDLSHEFVEDIEEILTSPIVDLKRLSKFAQFGYPEKYRSTIWKLLLTFWPVKRDEWQQKSLEHKSVYEDFINQYLQRWFNEDELRELQEIDLDETRRTQICARINPNMEEYQQDFNLWEQIEKDTQRTKVELEFFSQRVANTRKIQFFTLITRDRMNNLQETHADVLSRLLYIYGKLNTSIRYVQGMNELLANIYLVFQKTDDPDTLESDVFFCFVLLMGQTHDNFIRSLDTVSGINHKMRKLNETLKQIDPVLRVHFDNMNMDVAYYSYRWLLLYLSHDFVFEDLILIWDSIFSKPNQSKYLICLCLAILQMLRDDLLQLDFNDALKMLQNFKISKLTELIQNANSLECLYQK